MGRPLVPRDRARRKRDEVLELSIRCVAAFVTLTVMGIVIQPTVRTGPLASYFDDIQHPMGPFLFAAGVAIPVAWALSTLLVEHRRPWPFGPRDPNPSRPPVVANFAAYVVGWATLNLTGAIWPESHLSFPDDRFVEVTIPAETATRIIAALAVYVITWILFPLILDRVRTMRRGAPARAGS
jgi:hypothetical protein